jgi:hypothetical protein
MGDARRYVAGALATLASAAFSIAVLASGAGAQAVVPSTTNVPIISSINAQLNTPTGISEDNLFNIYIGDTGHNRIRKVTPGGVVTTFAGNGTFGFSGDGGPATAAELAAPTGTAVDAAGDVFIADTDNNRVREVLANGTIQTYAGNGKCQWSGDMHAATRAGLCLPTGVALDANNDLFIADSGNNIVRKVTPDGIITTFAGLGASGSMGDGGAANHAKLNTPTGVAVNNTIHSVYIADTGNSKVRVVNSFDGSGIISTFAGNGTFGFSGDGGKAPLAQLASPTGIGVDPLGNVYIADTQNNRVRVVIPLGDIFTYAGTGVAGYSGDGGPATQAQINGPTGTVAVDGQNVYFADTNNNVVRRVIGGPPPNIPETPLNVALLPLTALAILGGGFVLLRRRRPHGAATA